MTKEQINALRDAYDKMRKHNDREARYIGDTFVELWPHRQRYGAEAVLNTMGRLYGETLERTYADRLEARQLLREIVRETPVSA